MSRFRAILTLLLAVAWCSAAWHVELEAAGMLAEHDHHGHADAGQPADNPHPVAGDQHDSLLDVQVARQGQLAFGLTTLLGLALLGALAALGLSRWRGEEPRESGPPERGRPPALRCAWHFLQRCAPKAAAPPAWA